MERPIGVRLLLATATTAAAEMHHSFRLNLAVAARCSTPSRQGIAAGSGIRLRAGPLVRERAMRACLLPRAARPLQECAVKGATPAATQTQQDRLSCFFSTAAKVHSCRIRREGGKRADKIIMKGEARPLEVLSAFQNSFFRLRKAPQLKE